MKKLLLMLLLLSSFAFGKVEIKVEEKKPVVTEKKETKKVTTPVKKVGTLSISADETGELYVDGGFVRCVGKSSQNIVLDAGTRNIEVYFSNYTYKGSSTISQGKTTNLYIKKTGVDVLPSQVIILKHDVNKNEVDSKLESDKDINLSYEFTNQGNESAKKIISKVYLKENGNWREIGSSIAESLNKGDYSVSILFLGKLKPGQYAIKIVVDPNNEIWESNESNNVYERTFEVKDTNKDPAYLSYAFVQGGTFTMGDTFGYGYSEISPAHRVTLDSFYISKYEVTQKEYKEIMGYNPSDFSGDNRPVESVTWYDAVMYANKLSEREGLKPYYIISNIIKDNNGITTDGKSITNAIVNIAGGKGYRLPTEAEWEYAARGGKQSKGYIYSGSNNINEVAEYEGNNDESTRPVAGKKTNELGIYDMSGNVWEWCWDYYGDYTISNKINPIGVTKGSENVIRGGSYFDEKELNYVVSRDDRYPYDSVGRIGFRLVRSY